MPTPPFTVERPGMAGLLRRSRGAWTILRASSQDMVGAFAS